jgi:hypothetical protein
MVCAVEDNLKVYGTQAKKRMRADLTVTAAPKTLAVFSPDTKQTTSMQTIVFGREEPYFRFQSTRG